MTTCNFNIASPSLYGFLVGPMNTRINQPRERQEGQGKNMLAGGISLSYNMVTPYLFNQLQHTTGAFE